MLTNQHFVWIYLNSGPDAIKRVPSSDRDRGELSIDDKHDSVQSNEKKIADDQKRGKFGVLRHMYAFTTMACINIGFNSMFTEYMWRH